jgi:acetate CoA/acetoacetate CoA-transferase alpha subunit
MRDTMQVLKPGEAAELIADGSKLLIGGFMGVGSPHRLIDALVKRNARRLTIIANDTSVPGNGVGKLISAGCVAKAIVSHIGLNPETQSKMRAGEIEVQLVPQGTLVECIRAGGVGLGGILTATGVGTLVEEGKKFIDIGEKRYLIEMPISPLSPHRGRIIMVIWSIHLRPKTLIQLWLSLPKL